ncbi:MAG: nicotinate-nucleotide adenylyltransferase [Chthoniobacterales bacterium]
MKRIALYGGTFDPIHHGHLILARETVEVFTLDQLFFIPAAVSPHKLDLATAPAELRLAMLVAAIQGEPRFSIDELEQQRPPPSYAIDTVEAFRGRYPDAELFYLIGEDQLARLSTWHRFLELEQMVKFIVLNRGGAAAHHPYLSVDRQVEISATDIRNRVATRRSIRYLVTKAAEAIIRERRLYQELDKSLKKI